MSIASASSWAVKLRASVFPVRFFVKVLLKALALAALLGLGFGAGWLASGVGVGRAVPDTSLEDRERAFVARMENVTLDGNFTVAWPEPRDGTFRDRYDIAGVTPLDGGRWRFAVRIRYGSVDAKLPVVVPVRWAGDVPMIHLVDADLPGLGEDFGATVLFLGDHYSGVWNHGAVGGFMWGTIGPSPDGD